MSLLSQGLTLDYGQPSLRNRLLPTLRWTAVAGTSARPSGESHFLRSLSEHFRQRTSLMHLSGTPARNLLRCGRARSMKIFERSKRGGASIHSEGGLRLTPRPLREMGTAPPRSLMSPPRSGLRQLLSTALGRGQSRIKLAAALPHAPHHRGQAPGQVPTGDAG